MKRIACEVPFCRRTAADCGVEGQEILCQKHYRAVPKDVRSRYTALRRSVERRMEVEPASMPADEQQKIVDDYLELRRMWGDIKRLAIEAAAGI